MRCVINLFIGSVLAATIATSCFAQSGPMSRSRAVAAATPVVVVATSAMMLGSSSTGLGPTRYRFGFWSSHDYQSVLRWPDCVAVDRGYSASLEGATTLI